MRDIIDIIKKRRSMRHYKTAMPTDFCIEKILEAGRWAPSGLNNQPWRFMVIKEREKKEGLSKFTKYAKIIKNAPVSIAVFLDKNDSYNRDKDIMAVGACIENMLLETYSLGLGSCWLGEILNQKRSVSRYLNIRSGLELMAVIVVGYPRRQIKSVFRKKLSGLKIK